MAINLARVATRLGISVEQATLLRESRGFTEDSIQNLPEKSLKRALRRLDYPDAPRARLAFRRAQARDDEGRLPNQPLVAALRQCDGMRLRGGRRRIAGVPTGGPVPPGQLGFTPPPPVAGLAPRRWQALGPGNIGGRTRTLLVHPTQHTTLWAGSVGGGVWQTLDGGQSWTPVDDFMANLAVTSLVMDPNDANLIYAATGEGFGNIDALRGGGIFVTRNGSTWSQLPSTAGSTWNMINRLAISADGAFLLAATNNGLRRSTDAARANWQDVLPEPVADVKFHPGDPLRAVAGSLNGGKSWLTTDGGATWALSMHNGPWGERVELCYARSSPNIVYASVGAGQGEIWRSTNGGQRFTKRRSRNQNGDPALYLGDQAWYNNVIWAGDPTDADFVIVGGIDLWRSTDGGHTLEDISTWWDSRSAHADHHAIVAHPAYDGVNNRTVFFGNDGGVQTAADVSSVGNEPAPPKVNGWTALNNSYGVTQFYGAAGHPASGVVIAGAQDNGTLAFDPASGAQAWKPIFGGDGGYCCADPTDPLVFYGEYVFLNIHRNEDGATTDDLDGDRYISGQFWNTVLRAWDWKPVPFQIPDAFNQRALFIAPFVLDPNDANRILAGGESLWRTNDAKTANTPNSGPRWSRIKPPSNGMISAIEVTPGDSDSVWVGYSEGEIWRSLDATSANPNWSRVDRQGPRPIAASRFCHQILVSPHSRDTVLVAFGGFSSDNVWRSDDAGASWTSLGGALPAAPVRALAIHPTQADWFYIGTEVGMFASEDRGQTWSPTNEGPANVSVEDLIWMNQKLICVTHGRGLFEIDLAVPGNAPPGGAGPGG